MTTRSLLLGAVASLAFVSAAGAYERNGWYIGLEGGGSWIDEMDVSGVFDPTPAGANVPFANTIEPDTGWAVLATVGYGFNNNWRVELEGGYRANETSSGFGDITEWSAMVNVLYDISLTDRLGLSLGVGAGADQASLDVDAGALLTFDESNISFAYQGIAGLSYAVTSRMDLFANYRYLRVHEPDWSGPATFLGTAGTLSVQADDISKHTATIGLRYHFGAPAAEPMVAPPPVAPPPVSEPAAPPREFIVFFGHNKSNLTAEAQEVCRQAAAAAKQFGSATITVVGHADRSGSPKYNQGLSQRRATTVKGALVGEGVPAGAITTSAKGENDPLVQTDDGVREPQNRRVHINL
jgi:outer membrane protein OmpA-like peptidoglycan-associated protein